MLNCHTYFELILKRIVKPVMCTRLNRVKSQFNLAVLISIIRGLFQMSNYLMDIYLRGWSTKCKKQNLELF